MKVILQNVGAVAWHSDAALVVKWEGRYKAHRWSKRERKGRGGSASSHWVPLGFRLTRLDYVRRLLDYGRESLKVLVARAHGDTPELDLQGVIWMLGQNIHPAQVKRLLKQHPQLGKRRSTARAKPATAEVHRKITVAHAVYGQAKDLEKLGKLRNKYHHRTLTSVTMQTEWMSDERMTEHFAVGLRFAKAAGKCGDDRCFLNLARLHRQYSATGAR